jgi:hypothetical protein
VKDSFVAKGLDKAKEKLRYENLSDEDKKMYDRFQENRRIENSVTYTAKQERNIEIAKNAIKKGSDNQFIADITGLTVAQIEQLRNEKG